MAEGWLPPQAPGGQPPPRFDMVAPGHAEAEPEATPAEPLPRLEPSLGPPPPVAATNGLALTALILGILGIALAVVTIGLGFILSIPCSVAACLCAARARARIDHGQLGGKRGRATAGYVLGVAGVVIGVAAAIGWIVWLLNGGDFDSLQRDLERYQDEHTRDAAVRAILGLLER